MADPAHTPRLSCIVTAFNEGELATVSIRSLLAQSFGDFEILLVDDGASERTREVLNGFDDPRIRYFRQANDGLSSARNRALFHARGDYLCFLDADDTRPSWAFSEMMRAAEHRPDCVFSPGLLREPSGQIAAFYDQDQFDALAMAELGTCAQEEGKARFAGALHRLACLEPQSANKMIRRDFLERHGLRFPSGLFFEDLLFHTALLMNLDSYAVTRLPCFTYYRRHGSRQLTRSSSPTRFDAISTATSTLELFSHSRHFQDAQMRALVLAATCKLVSWCEASIALEYRAGFQQALQAMLARIHPQYLQPLTADQETAVAGFAPWVAPALAYACDMRPAAMRPDHI